jgi:hypothetical protein
MIRFIWNIKCIRVVIRVIRGNILVELLGLLALLRGKSLQLAPTRRAAAAVL